jgi:hypothetical protein
VLLHILTTWSWVHSVRHTDRHTQHVRSDWDMCEVIQKNKWKQKKKERDLLCSKLSISYKKKKQSSLWSFSTFGLHHLNAEHHHSEIHSTCNIKKIIFHTNNVYRFTMWFISMKYEMMVRYCAMKPQLFPLIFFFISFQFNWVQARTYA